MHPVLPPGYSPAFGQFTGCGTAGPLRFSLILSIICSQNDKVLWLRIIRNEVKHGLKWEKYI